MREYVTLVGCGARKGTIACKAEDLYTSPLFRRARAWAETLSPGSWYIVSGKHGLLNPTDVISPYDYSLSGSAPKYLREWAAGVVSSLRNRGHAAETTDVVILAGNAYADPLSRALDAIGFSYEQPLKSLSLGARQHLLGVTRAAPTSWLQLEAMYTLLERLDAAGLYARPLETGGRWPQKGVYFFHEEGETRFGRNTPRIVRVGTHSVSRGSQATLWKRLKTHYGDGAGGGNHRSSIFRLHVGNAIIDRDSLHAPQWGLKRDSVDTTQGEALVESLVSEHIRKMRVTVVPVGDESSAYSDRSFIERGAIALLSTAGRVVDPPSANWLGNRSAHPTIRDSGLWNLDHVGSTIATGFLETLSGLIDNAVQGVVSDRALAPQGWHHSQRQISLF